jgi:predicted PurR-regulated permease PerM
MEELSASLKKKKLIVGIILAVLFVISSGSMVLSNFILNAQFQEQLPTIYSEIKTELDNDSTDLISDPNQAETQENIAIYQQAFAFAQTHVELAEQENLDLSKRNDLFATALLYQGAISQRNLPVYLYILPLLFAFLGLTLRPLFKFLQKRVRNKN